MAYFTPDDLDIDVDDFYNEMSDREKQEMYEMLINDGYGFGGNPNEPTGILTLEFNEIIEKISSNRLRLTNEEDEMLKKIASRF